MIIKKRIIDFISEKLILATPEEIEAVQPISKELVTIFGYSKIDIITRPQYEVSTPSEAKKYPVDIAVFENGKVKIIVECKSKNKKDGVNQLKKYLSLSEASYGIWFNGKERKYFKKIIKDGKIFDYQEINSIPVKGIESDQWLIKSQLKKCDDLKPIFKEIHSYISAHIVGSTQGFNIAENLIKVLFCKIYDERYKEDNEVLEFFALDSNESYEVKYRIFKIFEKVKNQYSTVFDKSDLIDFSADLIAYIVNRLKYISLMESQRDSIADAFEVFIGNALKGEHGQFFTPRNVIRFILKYIDKNFAPINSKMKIMDPACGTGGFIVEALDFVWKKINISNKNELQKQEEKINFAQTKIYGIDKDKFVAKVTKAYMCILGDGTSNVSNKDSLQFLEQHYNTVDLLLTNPPFGKKIKIKDTNILNNYILKSSGQKGTNPEVLFIELSVKLLKENGIMAIVVPEGIIGNYNDQYIRKFLNDNGKIISIVSLPVETFKPHTGIKSSIIIFKKSKVVEDYNTIFIDIKKIGNDKNGKILYKIDNFGNPSKDNEGHFIVDDEMDVFLQYNLNDVLPFNNIEFNKKIFSVPFSFVRENDFNLWPSYYGDFVNYNHSIVANPDKTFFTIEQLIENNVLESTEKKLLLSGNSIESINYSDDGEIPFLRTTDIKNVEIVRNPQKFVLKSFFDKQIKPLKKYDIIFVKDGKHCIGESAVVMSGEENALLQSHMYIFRTQKNNFLNIDQFNLIAELNSEYFLQQVKKAIFIQGTIPTIGKNIYKIKIGFLKDPKKLKQQAKSYKDILETRFEYKNKIKVKW